MGLELGLPALRFAAGYLIGMNERGGDLEFRQHSFRFSDENHNVNQNRLVRFAPLAGELGSRCTDCVRPDCCLRATVFVSQRLFSSKTDH